MLNSYNTSPSSILHAPECDTYTYKDSLVKIITVFSDKKEPIALVEDENGKLFEVLRSSLK